MTGKSLPTHNFTGTRHFEPLGGSPVGFHFRHHFTPLNNTPIPNKSSKPAFLNYFINYCKRSLADRLLILFGRKEHRHLPTFHAGPLDNIGNICERIADLFKNIHAQGSGINDLTPPEP